MAKMHKGVRSDAVSSFRAFHDRVVRQFSMISNMPQGLSATRTMPIGIMLFGPPGIGKTACLAVLKRDLAHAFGLANTTLCRNAAADFFSDFAGQTFCQIDDFQQKIVSIQEDKETFELIQLINTAAYLMPVETESLKCVSYANFAACFYTTNRRHLNLTSVHEPEAVLRRLHYKLIPCWSQAPAGKASNTKWGDLDFNFLSKAPETLKLDVNLLSYYCLDDQYKVVGHITHANLITNATALREVFISHTEAECQGGPLEEESIEELIQAIEEDVSGLDVDARHQCMRRYFLAAAFFYGMTVPFDEMPKTFGHMLGRIKKLSLLEDESSESYWSAINSMHGCVARGESLDLCVTDLVMNKWKVPDSIMTILTDSYVDGDFWIFSFPNHYEYKLMLNQLLHPLREARIKEEFQGPKFTPWRLFLAKAKPKIDIILDRLAGTYWRIALTSIAVVAPIAALACWLWDKNGNTIKGSKDSSDAKSESFDDYRLYEKKPITHKVRFGNKTQTMKRTSLRDKKQRMQRNLGATEAGSDTRVNQVVNSVMTRNAVSVRGFYVDNMTEITPIVQHGIFVKGHILLINRHFADVLFKKCTFLSYGNQNNHDNSRVSVASLKVIYPDSGDWALIYVPQSNLFPDITHHFITAESLDGVDRTDVLLAKCPNAWKKEREVIKYGDALLIDTKRCFTDPSGASYHTDYALQYKLPTAPGDCGSVVFVANNLVNGFIGGIHTATLGEGRNLGQLVFRDDLTYLVDELGDSANVTQSGPAFHNEVVIHPSPEVHYEIPNLLFVGKVEKKFATPTGLGKTALESTPAEPFLLNGSMLPANRCSKTAASLGIKGDIIKHNLTQKHMHHVTGYGKVYDRAWESMERNMLKRSKKYTLGVTTLSYKEALDGIACQQYHDRLPRNTAWGFPECKVYPGSDKKAIDTKETGAQVEAETMAFMEALKTQSPEVYFTLFAKDEVLAKTKIDECKVRLVYGSSTHVTLACRMLFGPFAAWCMENHTINGIAVGINPFGKDWDLLAKMLGSKGKNMFDFDIKKFDYNQCIELLRGFSKLVNRWCADDQVTQNMRTNLWRSIMNAYVIYGDEVFQRVGNICSGFAFTALLNSMVTQVWFISAWMLIMRNYKESDPDEFFRHVYLCTFGDDNVGSVSDAVSHIFNPTSIYQQFRAFGVTLTGSDKGDYVEGEVIDWRTLGQLSFLKRSFRYDTLLSRYLSPLDLNSIKKMCSWIKKSKDANKAWRDNVDNASIELSQYNTTDYAKFQSVYNAFIKNEGHEVVMCSYKMARNKLNSRTMDSCFDEVENEECVTQSGSLDDITCDPMLDLMEEADFIVQPSCKCCKVGDLSSVAKHQCNKPIDLPDGTQQCDFEAWYEMMCEYYDADHKLPVFAEFNIFVSKEEYLDCWQNKSRKQQWYMLYNISEVDRCTSPRIDLLWLDPHNWGLDGWIACSQLSFFGETQSGNIQDIQIIKFHNDSLFVNVSADGMSTNTFADKDVKEGREHKITDFLERAVPMENFSLVAGGSTMTVIGQWDFPAVAWANDMYSEKMANFRMLRCDITIRIIVNASPYATGILILFYSPFDALAGQRGWYGTLQNAMGYPHVLIDLGSGQSGELTFPYVAPQSAMDQATLTGNLGTFVLANCIPYDIVTGLPCNLKAYMRLSNVSLAVPTITSSLSMLAIEAIAARYLKRLEKKNIVLSMGGKGPVGSTQSSSLEDIPAKEENSKNKSHVVSSTLGAASSALGALSAVPVIGPYAALGSGLLRGASAATKFAGYCKENNLAAEQPIINCPAYRHTNAVGLDTSVVLGAHPANRVHQSPLMYSVGKDQMDIATYCSRESVVSSFSVTNATPVGDILFKIPVTPGYNRSPFGNTTQVDTTPLGYCASLFAFWRGGLVYKVIIAKNAFASFRLVFALVPGLNSSEILSTDNFENCYRQVIDFRDTASVIISVPYKSPYVWSRVLMGTDACNDPAWGSPTVQTGTLICYLETAVQQNPNNPEDFAGIVLVSGDPQTIEFAVADCSGGYALNPLGFAAKQMAVEPKGPVEPTFVVCDSSKVSLTSNLMKLDIEDELIDDPNTVGQTQSGTFTDADPAFTGTQTDVTPTTTLLPNGDNTHFAESACIGERITNLRELCRRFTLYPTTNTTALTALDPSYFGGEGEQYNLMLWRISWMFRFYSGGTRYKIIWTPTAAAGQIPPYMIRSTMSIVSYSTPPQPTWSAGFTQHASDFEHISWPGIDPAHEICVPFYRATPIAVVSNLASDPSANRPIVTVNLVGVAGTPVSVLIAGSDDFTFGVPVGTPRVARPNT